MKTKILLLSILLSLQLAAQNTATDSELKTIPTKRIAAETEILDNNRCYQLLLQEEILRCSGGYSDSEKNTPRARKLKALQYQWVLESCTEQDKRNYIEFRKNRY